jgi:hypothetical protein
MNPRLPLRRLITRRSQADEVLRTDTPCISETRKWLPDRTNSNLMSVCRVRLQPRRAPRNQELAGVTDAYSELLPEGKSPARARAVEGGQSNGCATLFTVRDGQAIFNARKISTRVSFASHRTRKFAVPFWAMRGSAYAMMAAVFATMSLALLSGWFGRRSLAIAILIICLVLSIYQFLFEIYSPETGFRMPWIQTQLHDPPVNGSGAGS